MSLINQANQNHATSDKQGSLSAMLMLRFSGSGGTVGQTKTTGRESTAVKNAATGTNDGFDTVLKEHMTTSLKTDNGKTDNFSDTDRKARPLHASTRERGSEGTTSADKRNGTINERGRAAGNERGKAAAPAGNPQETDTAEVESKTVGSAKKTGKTESTESVAVTDENSTQEESPLEVLRRILQAMLVLAAEMAKTTGETTESDQALPEGTEQTGETAVTAVADILAGNAQKTLSAETAKTLLDLFTQATGGADASLADKLSALLGEAGGKPSEFLQKLADILQQTGIGTDALKSLSVKLKTVAGGDAVMLKLDAVAENIRMKLHVLVQNGAAEEAESSGIEVPGAILVPGAATNAESGGSNPEGGNGQGTDVPMDASRATEKATEKTALATEGTASAPVNAASTAATVSAASGQQAGIRNAMAAGANLHAEDRQNLQQTARPNMPSPLADPQTSASVTGQLTAKVSELTGDARHEMELQLKPESLGKINLKLVEEKGQILAKFTAESEQVRAILESNMQLLKDALEKNGLSVQQLSVSVGQQSGRGRQEGQEGGEKGSGRGNAFGTKGVLVAAAFGQQGANLSVRVKDYLNGPNSTISLKA